MKDRSSCRQLRQLRAIDLLPLLVVVGLWLGVIPQALAEEAPAWMHAVVNAPLPEHTEKTEAVVLYSATNVTVSSADKIRTQVREAIKILRPEGRSRGTVWVFLNSHRKVKSLHGWCIPAQGKDYEVKDKDSIETSPPGAELIQDVKARILHIPAPDPGNIVGYEYEVEEEPFFLQDTWGFNQGIPFAKATTRCSCHQGGSTSQPGSIIPRSNPLKPEAISGNGKSAMCRGCGANPICPHSRASGVR